MELNLAIAIKDNKKDFYKHISKKRRFKENIPLLDSRRNLVTEDEEKIEVLKVAFASAFNGH